MDINNLDQAIRLHNKLNALGHQRQEVTSFACFQGPIAAGLSANRPALSAGVAAMLIVIDEQIAQAKTEVAQLQ